MGRAGRGGGFRGGGGRMSGGLGGSRASSGRGLGTTGGAGRAGRGLGTPVGRSGAAAPPPRVAPRAAAPRMAPPRRGPGFATGVGVGMGMGMMGGHRRRRWGWGGGWGWGRRRRMMHMGGMGMDMHGGMHMGMGPRPRGGGCGGGCMVLLMIIFVLVMISMFANVAMPIGTGMNPRQVITSPQVTRSTVRREPLPRNAADSSVPLLVDHPGWIANQTILSRGMQNFHDRTGVRPILYITTIIDGSIEPSDAQLSDFAERRYTELTRGNEAHVLVLIFENEQGQYGWWVTPGSQAAAVLDGEARDIILDYIARYWYGHLDEHDLFARVFDESSQRIMTVTRSQWIPVLVVVGILLILVLLFNWWKRKRDQKNLEFEQTERILNQPLETIGNQNDAASQLAQQYEDDNNNDNN